MNTEPRSATRATRRHMTKLSDAIQSARRRGGRPIGFGLDSSIDKKPQRGLLIAAIGSERNGADVHLLPSADDIADAVGTADDAPVGIASDTLSKQVVDDADGAGAVFVVFNPSTTNADALLSESLEYGVRIGADTTDETELRALGSLHPVIVVTDAVPDPLPVRDLLALRRLAMLVSAPLAVPVAAGASQTHLQSLRDSGVAVLLLDSPSAEDVEALREEVASIPEVSRKGRREAAPVVPSLGSAPDEDFDDRLES